MFAPAGIDSPSSTEAEVSPVASSVATSDRPKFSLKSLFIAPRIARTGDISPRPPSPAADVEGPGSQPLGSKKTKVGAPQLEKLKRRVRILAGGDATATTNVGDPAEQSPGTASEEFESSEQPGLEPGALKTQTDDEQAEETDQAAAEMLTLLRQLVAQPRRSRSALTVDTTPAPVARSEAVPLKANGGKRNQNAPGLPPHRPEPPGVEPINPKVHHRAPSISAADPVRPAVSQSVPAPPPPPSVHFPQPPYPPQMYMQDHRPGLNQSYYHSTHFAPSHQQQQQPPYPPPHQTPPHLPWSAQLYPPQPHPPGLPSAFQPSTAPPHQVAQPPWPSAQAHYAPQPSQQYPPPMYPHPWALQPWHPSSAAVALPQQAQYQPSPAQPYQWGTGAGHHPGYHTGPPRFSSIPFPHEGSPQPWSPLSPLTNPWGAVQPSEAYLPSDGLRLRAVPERPDMKPSAPLDIASEQGHIARSQVPEISPERRGSEGAAREKRTERDTPQREGAVAERAHNKPNDPGKMSLPVKHGGVNTAVPPIADEDQSSLKIQPTKLKAAVASEPSSGRSNVLSSSAASRATESRNRTPVPESRPSRSDVQSAQQNTTCVSEDHRGRPRPETTNGAKKARSADPSTPDQVARSEISSAAEVTRKAQATAGEAPFAGMLTKKETPSRKPDRVGSKQDGISRCPPDWTEALISLAKCISLAHVVFSRSQSRSGPKEGNEKEVAMALVMTMAKGLAGGGLSIAGVIDRMCGDQSIGQDLERELSKLATYIAHSPALAPKAASGKDGEGLSKAHRLVEMLLSNGKLQELMKDWPIAKYAQPNIFHIVRDLAMRFTKDELNVKVVLRAIMAVRKELKHPAQLRLENPGILDQLAVVLSRQLKRTEVDIPEGKSRRPALNQVEAASASQKRKDVPQSKAHSASSDVKGDAAPHGQHADLSKEAAQPRTRKQSSTTPKQPPPSLRPSRYQPSVPSSPAAAADSSDSAYSDSPIDSPGTLESDDEADKLLASADSGPLRPGRPPPSDGGSRSRERRPGKEQVRAAKQVLMQR